MTTVFDAVDALAASKLPEHERDGFRVYLLKSVDAGILLTGTWPQREYTRGPRKGLPDFGSGIKALGTRTVAVTDDEYSIAVGRPTKAELDAARAKGGDA